MKLEEAWNKIKAMENSKRFKPNQIHSILADLGVFITNPRTRLVLKSALNYNLWELICKANISNSEIVSIKTKLDNDGFSHEAINMVVDSFWHDNKIIKESQISNHNHAEKNISSKITATSSNSEIFDYLNSIFTIDTESFKRKGLVLQNISNLRYQVEKSEYNGRVFNNISLSFEIVGSRPYYISLNIYIYDTTGNLRQVCWIDSAFIKNKYSIVNNSKSVRLEILPHTISKIVLRIDNNHSIGHIFDHNAESIQRYKGNIESKLSHCEIIDSQVLHELTPQKGVLSFYIRFRVTRAIGNIGRFKSYYALIYDINGLLRQRCDLLSMGSMNSIDLFQADRDSEFFFISENSTLHPSILKIPFNEIGKIIIIDEV